MPPKAKRPSFLSQETDAMEEEESPLSQSQGGGRGKRSGSMQPPPAPGPGRRNRAASPAILPQLATGAVPPPHGERESTPPTPTRKRTRAEVSAAPEDSDAEGPPSRGSEEPDAPVPRGRARIVGTSGLPKHRPETRFPLDPPRTTPGTVFVTGDGAMGTLGIMDEEGDAMPSTEGKPRKVTHIDGRRVVDVAAGGLSSLALAVDPVTGEQTLFTWGCNDQGCLGRDKTQVDFLPFPAQGLPEGVRVVQVVSGDSVTLVLTEGGDVYGTGTWRDAQGIFGYLEKGQVQWTFSKLPGLSHVVSVAIGNNHAVAVDALGKVWTWGVGEHGALGRRIVGRFRAGSSMLPRKVNWRRGEHFAAVYSGGDHAFLVTADRLRVYAFGLNGYGQLGVGSLEDYSEAPREVVGLPEGERVRMCAGGEFHSMVLLEDGRLFAFGRNDDRQCGVDLDPYPPDPAAPPTPAPVTPEDAERATKGKAVLFPKHVDAFDEEIDFVACGSRYTVAVGRSGRMYGWGANALGNLGTRDEEGRDEPEEVNLQGRRALAVACGGNHAVWLLSEREGQAAANGAPAAAVNGAGAGAAAGQA